MHQEYPYRGSCDAHSQAPLSYPCTRITHSVLRLDRTVLGRGVSGCIKCNPTRRVTALKSTCGCSKEVMPIYTPEWAKFVVSYSILLITRIW